MKMLYLFGFSSRALDGLSLSPLGDLTWSLDCLIADEPGDARDRSNYILFEIPDVDYGMIPLVNADIVSQILPLSRVIKPPHLAWLDSCELIYRGKDQHPTCA